NAEDEDLLGCARAAFALLRRVHPKSWKRLERLVWGIYFDPTELAAAGRWRPSSARITLSAHWACARDGVDPRPPNDARAPHRAPGPRGRHDPGAARAPLHPRAAPLREASRRRAPRHDAHRQARLAAPFTALLRSALRGGAPARAAARGRVALVPPHRAATP